MTLEEILAQVREGILPLETAGNLIRQDGYKEMDYAKLDTGGRPAPGLQRLFTAATRQMSIC